MILDWAKVGCKHEVRGVSPVATLQRRCGCRLLSVSRSIVLTPRSHARSEPKPPGPGVPPCRRPPCRSSSRLRKLKLGSELAGVAVGLLSPSWVYLPYFLARIQAGGLRYDRTVAEGHKSRAIRNAGQVKNQRVMVVGGETCESGPAVDGVPQSWRAAGFPSERGSSDGGTAVSGLRSDDARRESATTAVSLAPGRQVA